jgi:hypothetical protein
MLIAMASELEIGVEGGRIVVRDPDSGFYAIYSKPSDQQRLLLERRKPSNDLELVARCSQAAVNKARELGWIV